MNPHNTLIYCARYQLYSIYDGGMNSVLSCI